MSKTWVLLEVTTVGGDKEMKALAGTEDLKCVNRALAAMKLFKDEAIKAGRDDLTLIHSTVTDNVDYNATLDECLDPSEDDSVAAILSLVKI